MTMIEATALRNSPIFEDASDDLLAQLSRIVQPRQLEKNETLFSQGDVGDALFIVDDGLLEISLISEDGRKISVNVLRKGDVFGEIALFDPGPRTASAIALSESRLGYISKSRLWQAAKDSYEITSELLALAGRRLRDMNAKFEAQVFLTVEGRLAAKLLFLSAMQPTDPRIEITQAELAEHVGATREMVSRTLNRWKRKSIIETRRGALILQDQKTLRELANPTAAF